MRHPITIFMLGFTLVLAACGGDSADTTTTVPAPPVTTSSVPATTQLPATTTTIAPGEWPLTGRPAGTDPSAEPILVAKIDNTSRSRPQLGLGEADLVVEVLVEGGIPRLLAFFQSSMPTEIGPIRSAREVDPKLLAPFDALFAVSGGQGFVVSAIREIATDVSHDRLGTEAYYRADDRPSLYDLILRTEDAFDQADESTESPSADIDNEWLRFGPGTDGEPALTISVSQSALNQVEYRYSQADDGYLRFHGDLPHETVSAESDEPTQIVANNVVVIFVSVLPTGRTDSSGSPVPDYQVTGEGDVLVFRDGVAVAGTWERSDDDEFFRFFDAAGDELLLTPGTTWIELTPNGRTVVWQ